MPSHFPLAKAFASMSIKWRVKWSAFELISTLSNFQQEKKRTLGRWQRRRVRTPQTYQNPIILDCTMQYTWYCISLHIGLTIDIKKFKMFVLLVKTLVANVQCLCTLYMNAEFCYHVAMLDWVFANSLGLCWELQNIVYVYWYRKRCELRLILRLKSLFEFDFLSL